jgi:DNA-binding NarL/FixJ family response regulator
MSSKPEEIDRPETGAMNVGGASAAGLGLAGPTTKTVVVVEDDRGLREQLVKILNLAEGIQCVWACPNGEEAVRVVPQRRPDVVLMDIGLPGMSGIDCVATLKERLPWVQFIMLTVYEDTESIFRALKAGADGYLVKSSPPDKLLEAIQDVSKGGAAMSSPIARKVVQYFHPLHRAGNRKTSTPEDVSLREREVLDLLSSGYIYKEIGDKLGIQTETVRTHVKNICEKMHVRNRVEAVARHRP